MVIFRSYVNVYQRVIGCISVTFINVPKTKEDRLEKNVDKNKNHITHDILDILDSYGINYQCTNRTCHIFSHNYSAIEQLWIYWMSFFTHRTGRASNSCGQVFRDVPPGARCVEWSMVRSSRKSWVSWGGYTVNWLVVTGTYFFWWLSIYWE